MSSRKGIGFCQQSEVDQMIHFFSLTAQLITLELIIMMV